MIDTKVPVSGLPATRFLESYAGIVRPHMQRMVQVAKAILRSDDLAWDAVQETLLAYWKNGPVLTPQSWLVRTVVHRSLHLLRTRRRCLKHERVACSRCQEELLRDPAEALEQAELRRSIGCAIASLPADQRTVIALRELEGLDYETMACRLQVPIGTIRSRLNRARRALREQLAADFLQGHAGEALHRPPADSQEG